MRSISGVEYDSVSQARSTPFPCVPVLAKIHSAGRVHHDLQDPKSPRPSAFRGEIPLSGPRAASPARNVDVEPRPFSQIEQSLSGRFPTASNPTFGPPTRSQKYSVALRRRPAFHWEAAMPADRWRAADRENSRTQNCIKISCAITQWPRFINTLNKTNAMMIPTARHPNNQTTTLATIPIVQADN